MALSREAQQLLAGITGGIAGGLAGGKTGAGAGIHAAMDATGAALDRREEQSRELAERKMKEQVLLQRAQSESINTQLKLLEIEGLTPDSKQTLANSIAEMTGMSPEALKIKQTKTLQFADFMEQMSQDDLPPEIKAELWQNHAKDFGFDTQADTITWETFNEVLGGMENEEVTRILEDLRDPNKTHDIAAAAQLIANFNGEGQPITTAQAKVLGVYPETGLTFEQQLALRQQSANRGAGTQGTLDEDQMVRLVSSWMEAQAIMGNTTLRFDEFQSVLDYMINGYVYFAEEFRRATGQGEGTADPTNAETGN